MEKKIFFINTGEINLAENYGFLKIQFFKNNSGRNNPNFYNIYKNRYRCVDGVFK